MRDEIDTVPKDLNAIAPVPRVTQHVVELVIGLNTAISQIVETISSTYLQPFKTFNKVASTIDNV